MSKWSDFYENRLNDRYLNHIRSKYAPFISKIDDHIKLFHQGRIIEVGAGMGNVTKILTNNFDNRDFCVIEPDHDMMKLLLRNIVKTNKIQTISGLIYSTRITERDITHSHGVLEHLSNEDIHSWIHHERYAAACVHYVPSNKYEHPSFGDERLLSPDQWRALTNYNVESFNDGYDLILWRCRYNSKH